jgi:hypothetical protein
MPGNAPIAHLERSRQGFSGKLIIGEDLIRIGVGKAGSRMSDVSQQ